MHDFIAPGFNQTTKLQLHAHFVSFKVRPVWQKLPVNQKTIKMEG